MVNGELESKIEDKEIREKTKKDAERYKEHSISRYRSLLERKTNEGWQKENVRHKGREVSIRRAVGCKAGECSEGDRDTAKLTWKDTRRWGNSEQPHRQSSWQPVGKF